MYITKVNKYYSNVVSKDIFPKYFAVASKYTLKGDTPSYVTKSIPAVLSSKFLGAASASF